ncbi:MAG TPA: prepilin-type N-terminal cleavage/methylation domain-containing protein, partial [Pirellulales bacterium]|nr:prepilin-type N-terminal cleavage/methylation domain-containing protein [Pirellulales bacterium]
MTAFLSEYHKRDRGFTLVEVLIVIAVIALLVSMTSFAAYQALLYTKERAIIAEIGLMSAALETYKETRNSYPPCMAAVFWGTLSQPTMPTYSYYLTRQAAMNNHTQPAYNNMTINTTTFVTANSSGIFTYKYYNLTPSGQVVKLDMNTIDPAEALVFWLAGFPCPYITTMNGYIAPKKLIGFSKNQSNPFTVTFTPTMSSNQFLSMRTTPLFDFDERRLGDCDNDGWYEYYPEKPDFSATPTAPYVYYDAQLYTSWKMPPAIATQMAPMVGYPPAQNYIPNMLGRNQ